MKRDFSGDFLWGAATAAAQIEGAVAADGRGESIWDRFAGVPGAVRDGSTPAVACDSFHHIDRDVAALKLLGVGAYRFSVAWPRIVPDGDGAVNERGFDYYDRLIDALLDAGIAPWVTLFHWDLPQRLEDQGGWLVRPTADAFARYAGLVGARLGDRVKNFMTFNEIPTFAGKGYRDGVFAPGKRCGEAEMRVIFHHILLAHGLGARALRAAVPAVRIGLAHDPTSRMPLIEDAGHIAAASAAFDAANGRLLGALFHGRYPDGEAPFAANRPGDLDLISTPLDFLGLNIYSGAFAVPDAAHGFAVPELPPGYPAAADLSWLAWCPTALYWSPRFIHERYFAGPLYITENGYASSASRSRDELLLDSDRIGYLRQTLRQVGRAAESGIPLHGYFAWSLLDNFEWAEGYTQRFGLFHTDYRTLELTPKASARFYAAAVRTGVIP